ncbi:acetylcholine receptor subunit alpha-like [Plakobranchus ocellatus]|uniref:Acetylcholine receptor subunit alpha-like n=1 Tax=Plakobranchus ocellatus TaxID=259542 RepID=A0AAV3YT39_9GAST|nr:acetylcholine receptor subunit alpha-like [Plakobranchus ocellatus]
MGAIANTKQGELYLLGPLSRRGAGGGARTRDRRVPADLRADSLATVPPAPLSHGIKTRNGKLPTLCALLLISPHPCGGGTYSEKKSIYDALLNSSRYNPEMRPLLNQSDIMYVDSVFELVSIVEINDVVQSFHCNGFLGLRWYDEVRRRQWSVEAQLTIKDELITWDPAEYGGEIAISPKVQDVFRPRMVMLNTLEDRDLFEDDYA